MQRRSTIAWTACLLAAFSQCAQADTAFTVEAGSGHSDNIMRVDGGETDETIATVGLDLSLDVDRSHFTADVNVNADYYDYLDDTYDSEVMGAADAQLNFAIVPQRFNWRVEDYYGQQSNDPFSPATPETREGVNYLSTGPDLLLRFGSVGVRMFGQYSLATYEVSPIDNERLIGGFSVGRPGADARGLSFNAAHESVTFDEQDGNDFDRLSTYLAYDANGARTKLSVHGGYTWLQPEQGEESGAPRLLVDVERELTRHSTLELSVGTQLTDSSTALSSSVDGPVGGGAATVTAAADPYENRHASLSWNFSRRRTSMSIGAEWDEYIYETDSALDRTMASLFFSIDRRIGARIGASLNANLVEEDFDSAGSSAKSREFGASLTWDFGRAVGLRFSLQRSERDTSTGFGEYIENRAFLSIYYNGGRGTPVGGAER